VIDPDGTREPEPGRRLTVALMKTGHAGHANLSAPSRTGAAHNIFEGKRAQ
jgi:hypothetical protein